HRADDALGRDAHAREPPRRVGERHTAAGGAAGRERPGGQADRLEELAAIEGGCHPVMMPPSIVTAVPVIQPESAEPRKSAARAASSGWPSRFSSVLRPASATASAGLGKATAESQSSGVSTGPGQIALTR